MAQCNDSVFYGSVRPRTELPSLPHYSIATAFPMLAAAVFPYIFFRVLPYSDTPSFIYLQWDVV
jgi:hypothetical protein